MGCAGLAAQLDVRRTNNKGLTMKKLVPFLFILLSAMIVISGCSRDAEIVSYNISQDADAFKIYRRVVFYNGITDKYILVIQGYCSIDNDGKRIAVTVKDDSGNYLKHYLGLSDNVTYFAEQINPSHESDKRYNVVFKPESIIPIVTVK